VEDFDSTHVMAETVMQMLLDAGADGDLVDEFGHSAWWYLENKLDLSPCTRFRILQTLHCMFSTPSLLQ
jgi:hypothetical protein